jgi:hypothetical protein
MNTYQIIIDDEDILDTIDANSAGAAREKFLERISILSHEENKEPDVIVKKEG